MYRSQQLAIKYLTTAIALFGVMVIAGLMSAYYYINPDFLFGVLDFNIAKILHINTLVIWLLMGFMFLAHQFGRPRWIQTNSTRTSATSGKRSRSTSFISSVIISPSGQAGVVIVRAISIPSRYAQRDKPAPDQRY